MEKDQANAASEALMAQANADQSRRSEKARDKPFKPSWRAVGFGLMGCGVGIAIGSGAGNGLLFGSVGFAIGMALGLASARRQA
jgi:F0F1-type ATP synthase assembly protein I